MLSVTDYNIMAVFDDLISPLSGGRDGRHSVARFVERADTRARQARCPRLAQAADALNVSQITLGDYSFSSLGNMQRIDGAVDWVQNRGAEVERKVARPLGRDSLPGTPIVHGIVDGAQDGFWELYRFAERVIVGLLDETVINGIENNTDRAINSFHRQPAEVIVPPSPPPETGE